MSNPEFRIDSALISAQWERAKGELRATASIVGSFHGGGKGTFDNYSLFDKKIEEFIKDVEEAYLNESPI